MGDRVRADRQPADRRRSAFSSSQDMQRSRQIAAWSTPWRAHSAPISRCRSCSCSRAASRAGGHTRPACRPPSWCRSGRRMAAHGGLDGRGLRDRPLQRDPPQPAGAFGEIAGDVTREGRGKFAHHRQRMVAVVAIAVVEGESRRSGARISGSSSRSCISSMVTMSMSCDFRCASTARRNSRCHLEMAVRLEIVGTARPHMVQHEHRADAGQDRPQQDMRAGEIKRSQSGADNGVAKLLHCARGLPIGILSR